MTYTEAAVLPASADFAATIDAMRAATTTPSLAATFPTHGRHWGRTSPLPIRITRAARRLAHVGGMVPEGCSQEDMERVRCNHRIHVDAIKEILGTLWSFRLLGWLPSDTIYLDFDQITKTVTAGSHRPKDTQDLMPDWFTRRHSVDELKAFRDGKPV
ncbi:hypothetical protein NKI36_17985 [Mesorhizobium caraganae]|uniref:Uncharacterized protein n=1 Tax=Mesorhizobium caraganae TaxID=483206 RepID=A0ABV1Z1M7_9HYPH